LKKDHEFPENELPGLISEGNKAAFRQLYGSYFNHLFAFTTRITRCPDLAQDVVQDVFLKVWENRLAFRHITSVRAYLFSACKNQALNAIKSTERERQTTKKYAEESVRQRESPASQLQLRRTENLLKTAIEQLPMRRKHIFQLCKIEGRSYRRVAAGLGISAGTVNDHIVKATKAILKYLKRYKIG
jgi:RNA polymerase sigma-70 factor (family 1)